MKKINGWAIGSVFVALMIILPNFDIVRRLFNKPSKNWEHISQYLLKDSVISSIILVFFTVFIAGVIASALAWFVTIYDFPFKKFLSFGLLLPIAIPPYIAAYTYAGMLSYTGAVQRFLRFLFQVEFLPQKIFDIMNLSGAIGIFALFLYPYMYIVLRSFLHKQSASLIESSKLLGHSMAGTYFRIILPLTKNALIAGGTLVAFETLSDYGVVSYFGVSVLSTAIFKSWLSFDDVDSALRLSAFFLIAIALILTVIGILQKKIPTSFATARIKPIKPIRVVGIKKIIIMVVVYGIFLLAFIIPLLQMIVWSLYSFKNVPLGDIWLMACNSFILALVSSVIIVVCALIMANYRRNFRTFYSSITSKIAVIGYSIPSGVVAITVLLFFLDIDSILLTHINQTIYMVVFAYIIRYMAIAYQNIDSGFGKIGLKFLESSRVLGYSRLKTLFYVDIPMIKSALIGAFLLTFVDIVKELSILLILRPFNFYTLSTKVFEYAHDEMIPESSIASLLIICMSVVPILILYGLNIFQKKERE